MSKREHDGVVLPSWVKHVSISHRKFDQFYGVPMMPHDWYASLWGDGRGRHTSVGSGDTPDDAIRDAIARYERRETAQ